MAAGARLPQRKGFEATRPPDVSDACWQAALRGLQAFVAGGRCDEALRLGWSHDELFGAPPLWARVDLTGVALLISDNEVVEVTATEIRTKTATGAIQTFRRKPEPGLAAVYREQLRLRRCDSAAADEEGRLRALEFTVNAYRSHTGADLEAAKAAVLSAIAAKGGLQ
jgi:hypothetical protein